MRSSAASLVRPKPGQKPAAVVVTERKTSKDTRPGLTSSPIEDARFLRQRGHVAAWASGIRSPGLGEFL